jgi:hypothetical protein
MVKLIREQSAGTLIHLRWLGRECQPKEPAPAKRQVLKDTVSWDLGSFWNTAKTRKVSYLNFLLLLILRLIFDDGFPVMCLALRFVSL